MDIKALEDVPPFEWPPETADRLLEVLNDPGADPEQFLVAVRLAGNFVVVNDQLALALLAILSDITQVDDIRSLAAMSLGPALDDMDLADPTDPTDITRLTRPVFRQVQDSLRKLFQDTATPDDTRMCILKASVCAPEDWHKAAIADAYASGDRDLILTAVSCMNNVQGFSKEIMQALKNPDLEIQGEAIAAAGGWDLKAAWPHVRKLLKDPDTPKDLLLEAIDATPNLSPKEAESFLTPFTDSNDDDIAEAARDAIAMISTDFGEDDVWIN